ncbi:MAG: hypothetical protein HYZ72_02360 [Deltaproteobacteria bacterium]|nr:hypothetical protein [Deltaproteobacteria bacterium]
MLVFQAVLIFGSGEQRIFRVLAGEVSPYNIGNLFAYALKFLKEDSALCQLTVTLTGEGKEAARPEVVNRLQELEGHGIKVSVW